MGPSSQKGSDDGWAPWGQTPLLGSVQGWGLSLSQISRPFILLLKLRTLIGVQNEYTNCAATMNQRGKDKLPRTEKSRIRIQSLKESYQADKIKID